MMKNEKLLSVLEDSYRNIEFISRYKELMLKFNDFENRLKKVDKNEILKITKDLGYLFKVFTPGQDFYVENKISSFKFIFSFKCKGGILENYFFIFYNEEKIILEENLAFLYRFLLNDMDLPVKALKFKNYFEFGEIIRSLLLIYEDFKTEFLKQVEYANLN